MGFQTFKRPLDARTKASTDIKAEHINCSSDIEGMRGFGFGSVNAATSASTALQTRGIVSFETTSTTGSVIYTLSAPSKGDELRVSVKSMGATSGDIHIVSTGSFDSALGTLVLSSSAPSAILTCLTSAASKWAIFGDAVTIAST